MNLTIDRESLEPAYEQIRRQITQLIRDGLLPAGQKLPSVRELARSLGLSIKTVRSAYDELTAQNLIETRTGSGTFVTGLPRVATGQNLRTLAEVSSRLAKLPAMDWDPFKFNGEYFDMPWSQQHRGKVIRLHQTNPDPSLFPFERIKQIATNMLWYPKEFFFDYGDAQGYQPLVEYLEKEMALAGVPMAVGENDILLTGGFQRALTLVLDQLILPGQKVAVESPSFSGILNLLIAKRIGYVPIPVDQDGMDTSILARVLAKSDIKAIVTVPTYHNPTGYTLSQSRREHLIKLAAKYQVPVIEDDWGRLLRYDGEAPVPLKALDPGGYVIHIGTFSKCFLPGLRIGWITCPSKLAITLFDAKTGSDVGDSYFLQALLHEFILKGHFDKHIRKTVTEYKKRRNAMCKALSEHLPAGCEFSTPSGGLSIWVTLPKNIKSVPLLSLARAVGVEFLPAAFCMPDRKDSNALRLSFSRNSPELIERGVRILCNLLQDCIDKPSLLKAGAQRYEDLFK